MTSIPSTGSDPGRPAAGSRRPQLAAGGLALIGAGLGALLVAAGTGRWPVSLALVAIAILAIALDGARALFAWPGLRRGLIVVVDFDVFALGILAGAWAAGGGGGALGLVLATAGLVVAALGYAFRGQVLAAFMAPASSPLGIALALVPALGGAAGGIVLVRLYPGPAAPAVVMTLVALYIVLFAQAALLRVQVPGWQPPARTPRDPRPRSTNTGRRPR